MAQLLVRNIEDGLKERLRRRAKQHGRSMEEEAREILRNALGAVEGPREGLGTRLARRFRGIGFPHGLKEFRSPIRPPLFKQ